MGHTLRHRLRLAGAFVSAARCYWLAVFPLVRRELNFWRARARRIPDPHLRHLALSVFGCKRFNVEGAAAFAILAPAASRRTLVKALVCFQMAYDYADTVAEQPAASDPIANGRLLHQPLLHAFGPEAAKNLDYYKHSRHTDDGGYLQALTSSCRTAFHRLPSHALVRVSAARAAERIAVYQAFNHSDPGARGTLAYWALQQTPPRSGLEWWETAAACASSLTVLALLSAAADPALNEAGVCAIEDAYHPWIAALHTLLDSLIDWSEDEKDGQPSLLDNYTSKDDLANRMGSLATRAQSTTSRLPRSASHSAIVAAMMSVYLTAPAARTPRTRPVHDAVAHTSGPLMAPSRAVLKLRRASIRTKDP